MQFLVVMMFSSVLCNKNQNISQVSESFPLENNVRCRKQQISVSVLCIIHTVSAESVFCLCRVVWCRRCLQGLLGHLTWSLNVKWESYGGNLSDTHHFFHHLHNEAMEAWGMAFSLCVCAVQQEKVRTQPDDVMVIKEVATIKEVIELRAQYHFQWNHIAMFHEGNKNLTDDQEQ